MDRLSNLRYATMSLPDDLAPPSREALSGIALTSAGVYSENAIRVDFWTLPGYLGPAQK